MNRDRSVLEHIRYFCDLIRNGITRFGDNFTVFESDVEYRHAILLCIIQIGELVNILSDDYKMSTRLAINWANIKGMRNICVHQYGEIDVEMLWETIHQDIPILKSFCEEQIQLEDKG